MMDPFSHVVKSKSSNSAIVPKSSDRRYQKSSGSSFTIQRPISLKKRGVYVKKKSSKNGHKKDTRQLQDNETPVFVVPTVPEVPDAPPRANNKRFVNSVLNILSKASTGTQYPDTPLPESVRYCNSPEPNNERRKFHTQRIKTSDSKKRTNTYTRNQKSKSSETKVKGDNSVIVLEPKRHIIQTPSNYSERSYKDMTDPAMWAKLPCLINNEDSKKYISTIQIQEKELNPQYSKEEHQNKIKFELTKKATDVSTLTDKKSNHLLYDFFVDLLQTTISVYNLKPEYNQNSKSSLKFEIDVDVVNKLNIKEQIPETCSIKDKESFNNGKEELFSGSNEEIENLWLTKRHISNSARFTKTPIKTGVKKKIQIKTPVTYGTPNRKPYISRKARKRRFISLLKRELQIENFSYEEPQTLYDALKLMAKTKRKAAAVRPSSRKPPRETECKFDINRRRNIMTPAKLKRVEFERNIIPVRMKKIEEDVKPRRKRPEKPPIFIPKKQMKSLEVIGFDYENPATPEPGSVQLEKSPSLSTSSSTTTIRNRFSFDTFWGNQSSKNQLYSTVFPERHASRFRDFQNDLLADDQGFVIP